jgi:TonB family protein
MGPMKNITIRRFIALFGYVSFLAVAGNAAAQVGPVQPVLVLPGGNSELPHSRPDFADDFSVPVDVFVNADGTVQSAVVTESTGNLDADSAAAMYMRNRRFLPAVNEQGDPRVGAVKVTVNMFKRGTKKVVRVTVKPPPVAVETDRVKRMTCADFLWEIERMREDANIRDTSNEVMPYMSALVYKTYRKVPSEVEGKFWDLWEDALEQVVDRCEKQQTKLYFTDVLVPVLDGTLPASDTATAASP